MEDDIRLLSVQGQIKNLCVRAQKHWKESIYSSASVTIGVYAGESSYQAWFEVHFGKFIDVTPITEFPMGEGGTLHEALVNLSDKLEDVETESIQQLTHQVIEIEGKKYKIVPVD